MDVWAFGYMCRWSGVSLVVYRRCDYYGYRFLFNRLGWMWVGLLVNVIACASVSSFDASACGVRLYLFDVFVNWFVWCLACLWAYGFARLVVGCLVDVVSRVPYITRLYNKVCVWLLGPVCGRMCCWLRSAVASVFPFLRMCVRSCVVGWLDKWLVGSAAVSAMIFLLVYWLLGYGVGSLFAYLLAC